MVDNGVETRLGDVESRLDRVVASLDHVETRLSGVETRLNHVETKLDNIDVSLIKLSGELIEMKVRGEAYDVKLDAYQRASVQVVNLAFGLIITAVLAIIVPAVLGA